MASEFKKDEPIVIYCNGASCMRSSKATAKAVSWGYTKVYYYRDGFPAWKAASLPVE
jgi:rhodanese-related sulfurtransferase